MIKSLRDYLDVMKAKNRVLEIKDPVSREDIPELIDRLSVSKKVLLFENVVNYDFKLVANLVPSQDVFGILFDGAGNPRDAFLQRTNRRQPKIPVSRGHLNTIDVSGKDLRDILPILKHYKDDSAPYITTSVLSSVDPDSGLVGRGIHRMEYRGGNLMGASLINPPLGEIYQKYRARHEKMPITVCIGVDPVLFLSMALKVPLETDKLEVSGGLRGSGIEVVPSFDSPIQVPAESEIILEGYVDPDKGKQDGPLGEISGYYLTIKETPTVVIQRLSYRASPIYHALLPTCPEADMYLTFVSSAHMEESIKKLFPFISKITFIQKTFGSSVVVNIRSVERFKVRSLLVSLLSYPMIKKAVVVDEDVNSEDLKDVEWAFVTRCFSSEDVVIVKDLQGQPIDPQAKEGRGVSKIGIDATVQGKTMEARALVAKGDSVRIGTILNSIGGNYE
jgi:2,5-furandicarboxylate decarboxylase 1